MALLKSPVQSNLNHSNFSVGFCFGSFVGIPFNDVLAEMTWYFLDEITDIPVCGRRLYRRSGIRLGPYEYESIIIQLIPIIDTKLLFGGSAY
jgi:hypothetical protein